MQDAGEEPFDVVIIGGGIIGSGIARDAALRGYRVALVEKEDYGWGTTARSTRLVHGGLRYLEHYDFGLVREALRERATLIRIAPHLVEPLAFLLPMFKDRGRGRFLLRLGLILYDTLARANLGRHHWWKRERVVASEPTLDRPDLKGAFIFWDAQVRYPERVVVENMLDLWRAGGRSWNHTEAVGLELDERSGRAIGVRVRNRFTGIEDHIPCRNVLNVGGPWVTQVDNVLGVTEPALTRRTKGVHLLTDAFTEHAMVLQCGDGERIIFIVPWGDYSLVGTTDTDYTGDNDTVRATVDDVQYLLNETNANLDVHLGPEDIHYTYAGLRPLIPEGRGSTGAVSRRHILVDHAKDNGPDNLVSVVGGKITSYRHIAEDVVDDLRKKWGKAGKSRTARQPLPGGEPYDEITLRRDLGARLMHHTDDDVDRLFRLYGARVRDLLDTAIVSDDTGHLDKASRLTREEVRFVVEHEGAQTISDVLLRRTMLGLERDLALPVLKPLADYMAHLLQWDRARKKAEVEAYTKHVRLQREAVETLMGTYEPTAPDTWFGKQIRRLRRPRATA